MSKNSKNSPLTAENYIIKKARSLPIYKCYINDDWRTTGLAKIMIVRKHSNQHVTCGIYLMCLGIKDRFYYFNQHEDEVLHSVLSKSSSFIETGYNLVHNIIYGALAFADDYGFAPAKEWKISRFILEEDDDHIPMIDIDFGDAGIPVYVAGPYDDQSKIKIVTNTLKKTAGEGNYRIMLFDQFEKDEFESKYPDEMFPFEEGELEKIQNGEQRADIFQTYYLAKRSYQTNSQISEVLARQAILDKSLIHETLTQVSIYSEDEEYDIRDEVEELRATDHALEGIQDILEDFPESPFALTAYYDQAILLGRQVPQEIVNKLETDFPDYLAFRFTKAFHYYKRAI